MKKIKRILIFLMLIFCFLCAYNFLFTPFIIYDISVLENFESNTKISNSSKIYLNSFYKNFLNYEHFDSEKIEFKSVLGKESITYPVGYYLYESFSLIISFEDDYENNLEKIMNNLEFDSIPIENSNDINSLKVGSYWYYEICSELIINDYYDKNNIRNPSFWLGFSDIEKKSSIWFYV